MDISQSVWTEADASNNTPAPDGAPEGMFPSGVNDTIRADRGAIKRWYNQTIPMVTGGSSTAYTLTYGVAPTALADGQTHLVQFNAVNGANPTLNVNALGAKPLTFYCGGSWSTGTNTMPPFMLAVDQVVRVTYNAAAGTYRCIDLPLTLRQTVSGVATIDFQNLPTNVNNIQLLGQFSASLVTGLQLRTYTSAGAVSSGASDYSYSYIQWGGSSSGVATGTTSALLLVISLDSATLASIDAVASAIQSAANVQFNFGSQFTSSGTLAGTRGVGVRNSSAIISGIRIFPGAGTLSGTATLNLS